VVVSRSEEEQTTPGGIVIPDTAAEKPIKGKVVAVGPGKPLDNGDTRAMAVKEGDNVIFGKYAGTEVKLDGENYLVMREDDIMGVVQ
jgi:chaperonin GroES